MRLGVILRNKFISSSKNLEYCHRELDYKTAYKIKLLERLIL